MSTSPPPPAEALADALAEALAEALALESWANALLDRSIEPPAAPALAAARVLKKSLRLRDRDANSSAPGTSTLCLCIFSLPPLTRDPERRHGVLNGAKRQSLFKGDVVRRHNQDHDGDRAAVLALGVVDGDRGGQDVRALQRRGGTLVGADAHWLERRRVCGGVLREGERGLGRHVLTEVA